MRLTGRTRTLMALPQLAAIVLSLVVSQQVSLCPPGMESGSGMLQASAPGEPGPMDCPLGGSMDEEGNMSGPLAVGGPGPCGTSAAAASYNVALLPLDVSQGIIERHRSSGRFDRYLSVAIPPPKI